MPTFSERLKHAWNAFTGTAENTRDFGIASSIRPDRTRLTRGNERSIVSAIYNRIAVDVASISIEHVRLDENERYIETIDSGFNKCLSFSANMDQTGRALIQDIVMSMLDEGCVAVVPIETTFNPKVTGSYDITNLRTAKVVDWMPGHVRLNVYNERTGVRENIVLPKSAVAIIENPFYSVMNEPNSTMQRLIHKLNMLDAVDEQTSSGKLDLIIQLPYIVKTEARREQAEKRRKEIEEQLAGSKYGIAYTDGTEHITQLNRSLENNLLKEIEYLTSMLYSQLSMPKEIFEGTADEAKQLMYRKGTLEPIVSAIVNELRRKFLTKTAKTQGQSVCFFDDPFRLVSVNQLAEIADKFTRNEILTSNEVRQIIGFKPSSDPNADELRNKNLNKETSQLQPGNEVPASPNGDQNFEGLEGVNQNER